MLLVIIQHKNMETFNEITKSNFKLEKGLDFFFFLKKQPSKPTKKLTNQKSLVLLSPKYSY